MAGQQDANLKEGLLSALECPICFEFMQPPIRQCSAGHSLCCKCIDKLSSCPVCQTRIHNPPRNFSLETLSQQFMIGCSNAKAGCRKRLFHQDVVAHEKYCPFRTYDCPLAMDPTVDCSWRGLHGKILEHAKQKHPTVTMKKEQMSSFTSLHDFKTDYYHDVCVIYWGQEIFLSHDHYDSETSKYATAIQYIGPCEYASKYQYIAQYYSKDKSRGQSFYRKVHSEEEDIYTAIQTDDCFTITEKMLGHYYQQREKCVHNRWWIKRV